MRTKRFILPLLILVTLFVFASFASYGNLPLLSDIRVFINEKQLSFDIPPFSLNNRILVPVASIMRALGADVKWDGTRKIVTAIKDNTIITMPIDSPVAYKNNQPIELDVPARIISGRTFLPLRFISEGFGSKVSWDQSNRNIHITHEEQPNTFAIKGISIGTTLEEVNKVLGNPQRIDISEYGFRWYIYHKDYKDYLQLGILNQKVVAIYSNNVIWQNHYNINVGSSKNAVSAQLTKPTDRILKGNVYYISTTKGHQLYLLDDAYLTVYYDLHRDNQVTALQVIDKSIEDKYLYPLNPLTATDLRSAFERQVFDLANALRVREGLKPFEWNDLAAIAAQKHSKDMAENNFFNHYNLKRESPFDRMEKEGISYRAAGENIAAGQQNAIYAHEGWMNSFSGHREAILGNYQKLGVGVWFGGVNSTHNNYFTQNFFTPSTR